MRQDLYSPDEVARQLGLHVRTVRNYVREGRLKAVRIGKQYRISRADLDALTGRAASGSSEASGADPVVRHIDVSSIANIDGISRDQADRVTNGLMAATNGRPSGDDLLRVDTIYDEERLHLKVVFHGSLSATAHLLKLLAAYVEADT